MAAQPITRRRAAAAALAAFIVSWPMGATPALAEPALRFVALGDMPYGHETRTGPAYRHLIELVNAERVPFTIHVGDFKDGLTECSDALYERQYAYFQSYSTALIYTPGDNDWTDCQRQHADPLERLSALRQRFFASPRSLGARPIALQRQSEEQPAQARYPENQRWWLQGVLFVTVHTVGPDDNAKDESPALLREQAQRETANIAWLQATFELARRQSARAVVVATQADPFKDGRWPGDPPVVRKPFRRLLSDTLLPLATASRLPVLFIHGDSHHLISDQPFTDAKGRRLPGLWRLQVPGEERMHAVLVSVDPSAAQPFSMRLIWNPMSPNPR